MNGDDLAKVSNEQENDGNSCFIFLSIVWLARKCSYVVIIPPVDLFEILAILKNHKIFLLMKTLKPLYFLYFRPKYDTIFKKQLSRRPAMCCLAQVFHSSILITSLRQMTEKYTILCLKNKKPIYSYSSKERYVVIYTILFQIPETCLKSKSYTKHKCVHAYTNCICKPPQSINKLQKSHFAKITAIKKSSTCEVGVCIKWLYECLSYVVAERVLNLKIKTKLTWICNKAHYLEKKTFIPTGYAKNCEFNFNSPVLYTVLTRSGKWKTSR